MIVAKLVSAFLSSLTGLFSLFPSITVTTPATSGAFVLLGQANRVVPVATALNLLGLWLVILLALRGWDFAVWLYHQFWGSS